MKEMERILLTTDFSADAEMALRHASLLASRYGGELHVLHVRASGRKDPTHVEHYLPEEERYTEAVERFDREQMEKLPVTGVTPASKKTIRSASVAPAIVEHARTIGASLIVMGTRGRTGLSEVMLGSVAEQVIELSPVSVLIAGRKESPGLARGTYEKVLVAVDFSEASRHALAKGIGLARHLGAKLALLHVLEEPAHAAFRVFGQRSIRDLFPDLEKRCRSELDRYLAEGDAGDIETEVILSEGKAHERIAKAAKNLPADIVVMGTHGLSFIEKIFVGSVTSRVIRSAPCAVLAVR